MVHGRNSYKRSAALGQFVMHRGMIISTMQVFVSRSSAKAMSCFISLTLLVLLSSGCVLLHLLLCLGALIPGIPHGWVCHWTLSVHPVQLTCPVGSCVGVTDASYTTTASQ